MRIGRLLIPVALESATLPFHGATGQRSVTIRSEACADCSSTPTNYFGKSGFILIPAAPTFAPVATPIIGNAPGT
jgi:hypothetical protein